MALVLTGRDPEDPFKKFVHPGLLTDDEKDQILADLFISIDDGLIVYSDALHPINAGQPIRWGSLQPAYKEHK